MPQPPSAAQRAVQITFVLKGHLKNVQISFLRVAALLAKVRDEKLYAALKHPDLEDYAAVRLGLRRASLYRYLQLHDWAREFHPGWLARKPKGFIPELTDAYALMWIDRRIDDADVSDDLRRELEKAKRQALAGRLSQRTFQELQGRAAGAVSPLRRLLAALRSARQRATVVPGLPVDVREGLDTLVRRVEQIGKQTRTVAALRGLARVARG
jgi:hypothetical protein